MRAHLSRRYRLSASHRLHVAGYTDERNREVFGKCNNPYGHGHNYVVQVTVSGEVDPMTGMVVDLAALDGFAAEHLTAQYDHQNLNTLTVFAEAVPSTENLAMEVWRIFEGSAFGAGAGGRDGEQLVRLHGRSRSSASRRMTNVVAEGRSKGRSRSSASRRMTNVEVHS